MSWLAAPPSKTLEVFSNFLSYIWKKKQLNKSFSYICKKIFLFQIKIRFLGFEIEQGQIVPIVRSIEFANKFPDEIKDKKQLQRFLGSLNYIHEYYKILAQDSSPLYDRLKKDPPVWSSLHTAAVRTIKQKGKIFAMFFFSKSKLV